MCEELADPEYARIKVCATVLMIVWPIGVPLAYLLVLLPSRKHLLRGRSTTVIRATSFLHREYEPQFAFFWEPLFLMVRHVPPATAPRSLFFVCFLMSSSP